MLEDVLDVGGTALGADQVHCLELIEARLELLLLSGDLGDDVVEELAAHHRGVAQHPSPGFVQAVDTCGDHAADGGRNAHVEERARDAPGAVDALEHVRFDERVDDLFHVEGVTVGAPLDETRQLVRGLLVVEQRLEKLSRLARRELLELE